MYTEDIEFNKVADDVEKILHQEGLQITADVDTYGKVHVVVRDKKEQSHGEEGSFICNLKTLGSVPEATKWLKKEYLYG